MNIRKILFPYSGPWTSEYYNKFFHPNLCHVCKKTTEMINLTTCDRCFSISYCSKDHKNLHLPQHHEICIAIEKSLKNNPQYLTHRFSLEEWLEAQDEFYCSIRQNLGRLFKKYEKQMLTYARICFICHQQTGLYSCKKCLSVDYCLEHKEECEQQHEQICDHLTMWLNSELLNIQYESKVSLSLKFIMFPDNNGSFNNMTEFIQEHVQNRKGEWNVLDYICSDFISGPLSVYYEADSIERNGLPAWEILLHLFPNIQVLIVVLLGTDLQFEFDTQDICQRCVYNKKKFIYECCGMLYSNYMTNPMYGKANLIVGFQIFETESLTNECLKTMQSQECPVLLTTLERRIFHTIVEIQKVLGRDVCPVTHIENKFTSLRPHRESKYIFYRNSFLMLYKTLNNTNSTTESSSEGNSV
ncbi:uncharacterized protein LOC112588276 [Harpegnathos saltator]|uniref:uncharacterized protein LOC112588276 n=1 Tax=Harpegnathos saltator TaxID=610380 RepID=UPI000DBED488|nr:uncharacterized protein LOC112588276 [Harpegnathos saltator]